MTKERASLFSRLRQRLAPHLVTPVSWWHRHFGSNSCSDPTCPLHGDDPHTIYTGDDEDLL